MDKFRRQIKALGASNNVSKVASEVKSKFKKSNCWGREILVAVIDSSDRTEVLGYILTSLTGSEEDVSLKLQIYKNVLALISEETSVRAADAVVLLGIHTENFSTPQLLELIEVYMERIHQGKPLAEKWLDFLEKLLALVISRDSITVDGIHMTGEEYRSHFIRTICNIDWEPETTINILPVLKDLKPSSEELHVIISKVSQQLKTINLPSVPPVTYNLLLLCRDAHPGRAIEVIMNYFSEKEDVFYKARSEVARDDTPDSVTSTDAADFWEAQGTAILHITHLAQYDPQLIRDYLKVIRNSMWVTDLLLTPFNLALALSLASIHRNAESILDSLKHSLLKSFAFEEKRRKSCWLRQTWDQKHKVQATFLAVIRNSRSGWHQINQSVVELGFRLLECGSPLTPESYCSQCAVSLALLVIPLVLRNESCLVGHILDRISSLVYTSSYPRRYIDLLGVLVKNTPVLISEHIGRVLGILEELSAFPYVNAVHLLYALVPLMNFNMTLKDSLLIILRKMLFSRLLESRKIAIEGLLLFIRLYRIVGALPSSQGSMSFSSSISQVSVSVHNVMNPSSNEALCLEILGILRRVFCQQAEVRSTLYHGLKEVTKKNPKMLSSILSLLYQHGQAFFDFRDSILNPVCLKLVVSSKGENVILAEPIGELLSCISACRVNADKYLSKDDSDEDVAAVLNDVCSLFDRLVVKLSPCDLDDLGIDTGDDFSSDTVQGKTNVLYAQIMVSVYDALIEELFLRNGFTSEDNVETLITMLKLRKRIVSFVQDKVSARQAKKPGASKGRLPSAKSPVTFNYTVNLESASSMLFFVLGGEADSNATGCEILQENFAFTQYLLAVIKQCLSTFDNLSPYEQDLYLNPLKSIACALLSYCHKNAGFVGGPREADMMEQSLIHLESLFAIFFKHYPDRLVGILKEVTGKTDVSDLDQLLYSTVKILQGILTSLIQRSDSSLLKEGVRVTNLISSCCKKLSPEYRNMESLFDWAHQLCQDQEFDNPQFSEAFVNLVVGLAEQTQLSNSLPRNIAKHIHFQFGDIEENAEVEEVGQYKIVTDSNTQSCLFAVLNYLLDSIHSLELILNKAKNCLALNVPYDEETVNKHLIKKYVQLIHTVHEIIQAAIPQGPVMDQVFHVATKTYGILGSLIKYRLEVHRCKPSEDLPENLERLVILSANLLNNFIYKTISFTDKAQQQSKKKQSLMASRASREAKLIPDLIFSIEAYEKNLILLSKKTKVNFMASFKISTSRDFRIVTKVLDQAMDSEDTSQADESPEDNDEQQNAPPQCSRNNDEHSPSQTRHDMPSQLTQKRKLTQLRRSLSKKVKK